MDSDTFRRDFYDLMSVSPFVNLSPAQKVAINSNNRGLMAIRDSVERAFSEAAELYRDANDESSQIIADEIAYQAEMDREVALAVGTRTVESIDEARTYLGAQIEDVRWAIEKNTEVSQGILDALWTTHSIDSKQYFDEGAHWYENGERDLARGAFENAVRACSVNGFAHEYLGFLAVHDGDSEKAIRCFDLAAKCARNDHFRAMAHYHLSRAWHAVGDESKALSEIRTAVALRPDDLPYKLEQVCALMRTGFSKEAISELRTLISLDLHYWTVASIYRPLDPIRAEINSLLNEMREEERHKAETCIAELEKTVSQIQSIPEPIAFVVDGMPGWQGAMQNARALLPMRIIFAYRKVNETVPVTNRKIIEAAIQGYKARVTDINKGVEDCEQKGRAVVANILAEMQSLTRQLETAEADFKNEDESILGKFREGNELQGISFGCTGCLLIPAMFIFSIALSAGLEELRRGIGILLAGILLGFPFVYLVVARIRSSTRRDADRKGAQERAQSALSKIEAKRAAVQSTAREAESRYRKGLESRLAEAGRQKAAADQAIAILESRLAVVNPFAATGMGQGGHRNNAPTNQSIA